MFLNTYAYRYAKNFISLSIFLIIIGYYYSLKVYLISGIFIGILILYFYRKPLQNQIQEPNFLFSPCFGRVEDIKDGPNNTLVISIFIRITDPHIQYSPCTGIIVDKLYKKGSFYPLFMAKSKNNEKLIYNIQTSQEYSKKGIITIVQIGGIFSRTIKSFVKKSQLVFQNQELGLIGIASSKCEIYIPKDLKFKLLIKKGDDVFNTTKIIQFV